MNKDTIAGLAGVFSAVQTQRIADDELVRMADKVVLQRSDLSRETVLEQIIKLGTETVYDGKHWAQACLDLANLGLPLPWERGYTERQYLALLTKHND